MVHKHNFSKHSLKAFSLIEITVVVGIFFFIAILALPMAINQIETTKASTAMKELKSAIFLVEQNAFTEKNNSGYGIGFLTNSYIVFQGDSLATATAQDTYKYSNDVRISNVNFGSGNEVDFVKGSFRPAVSGSVDIASGSQSYRINISSEGLLTYEKL